MRGIVFLLPACCKTGGAYVLRARRLQVKVQIHHTSTLYTCQVSTHRIEKLQELLHHEIAQLLERDFRFPGMLLTVMGVRVSRDGLYATAHFSVFPE